MGDDYLNSLGSYGGVPFFTQPRGIAQPWYTPKIAGSTDFWSWDRFLGDGKAPGWGGLALQGTNALVNGFIGMKQYGLAKQQLAEGRRQFDLNYGAQRTAINSQMEDRQRARVAAEPGATESVDSYMARNRIV